MKKRNVFTNLELTWKSLNHTHHLAWENCINYILSLYATAALIIFVNAFSNNNFHFIQINEATILFQVELLLQRHILESFLLYLI